MREARMRYSAISIVLHWTIFGLIFANATVGGWMEDASGPDKLSYFGVHRSIGVSVLVLSLVRLGWRLAHPWPAFPARMARWERILARGTHVAFYVLMIAAPLLGWAAASAGNAPELPLFALVPFPNLPIAGEHLSEALGGIHKALVKSIYFVLALHVAGALKHHFLDRDEILHRMLPLLRIRGGQR